ncbi:MAG: TIGR02710 family CRISPR-associated protein [Sphingomonadales bacterium]|nr:MAG: TIGR02710 family CRISPR-associated protein [Sphingomonadales bacterium]
MTSAVRPSGQKQIAMLITVGGSADPICSAIRARSPAVVWFIVSDGADGSRSSKEMAIEIGAVFPAVTTQFLDVPPDDPNRTLDLCTQWIRELRKCYPDCAVVADYTGGTKSMSAGLLFAALGADGVEVQFMKGERSSLAGVTAGTEKPIPMTSDYLSADRDLRRAAALFHGYDYAAAHALLESLCARLQRQRLVTKAMSRRIDRGTRLCRMLALWDCFQHKAAAELAEQADESGNPVATVLRQLGLFEPLLKLGRDGDGQSSWPLCADLWLNAQRSAERKRFDDAIARLYRLTEAAIQAQLWTSHKIPNPIPWDSVPPALRKGREPQCLDESCRKHAILNLEQRIELLRYINPDDAMARIWHSERPDWTNKRNHSILAHGFKAIDEKGWKQASQWVTNQLRPFWTACEHPQLPRDLLSLID